MLGQACKEPRVPLDDNERRRRRFTSRKGFIAFNFSFFLVNLHVLNLPMAMMNIVVGAGARRLGLADLWVTYLVVALYSLVYLGVLDRIGMHFYPMFSPRSPFCLVAYSVLFAAYYAIYLGCNQILWTVPLSR